MSFTSIDHVIDLIENLLVTCWPIAEEKPQIVAPFKRIDYQTAMDKYGCDKPDLRSNIEITQLTNENESPDHLGYYMLVIPQEYDQSFAIKSIINDELSYLINTLNFKGQLNSFKWSSLPFQQNLNKTITEKLSNDVSSLKPNDYLWIASGDKANCVRMIKLNSYHLI